MITGLLYEWAVNKEETDLIDGIIVVFGFILFMVLDILLFPIELIITIILRIVRKIK